MSDEDKRIGKFDTCKICHVSGFLSVYHKCPPTWECWNKETSSQSESRLVFALDASSAAEKFLEEYCNAYAEYPQDGETSKVCVVVNGKTVTYDVTASFNIDFNAEEEE